MGGFILIWPSPSAGGYWYLPARYLTKDRYDSVARTGVDLKAFFHPTRGHNAIAEADTVVPNKHSIRLYESISAPRMYWPPARCKKRWFFSLLMPRSMTQNAAHGCGGSRGPATTAGRQINPTESWWQEAMQFLTAGGT